MGAVALAMAGPSVAWADQSNDNSTTTVASGGDPVVVPLTGAVQINLACPANVNVLADQAGTGSCAPGAQSNGNSSTTTAGGDGSSGLVGGTLVAPLTAAAQLNLSCPVNVNVVSTQRDAGNCTPGEQSNSNSADTLVYGTGAVGGVLGGPLVVPVTSGVGLNVTCPTNVNVLSAQSSSGACVAQTSSTGSVAPPPADAPPGDAPPADAPPADGPPADAPPGDAPPVTTTSARLPDLPDTGVPGIGRAAGSFPVLGVLALAVLAAAAVAVRRRQQQR